jgi:hypothetical protein
LRSPGIFWKSLEQQNVSCVGAMEFCSEFLRDFHYRSIIHCFLSFSWSSYQQIWVQPVIPFTAAVLLNVKAAQLSSFMCHVSLVHRLQMTTGWRPRVSFAGAVHISLLSGESREVKGSFHSSTWDDDLFLRVKTAGARTWPYIFELSDSKYTWVYGRAIAQAVSRRLPTAAARVQTVLHTHFWGAVSAYRLIFMLLRITVFFDFSHSSDILGTRKHSISETESISVLRYGAEGEDTYLLSRDP